MANEIVPGFATPPPGSVRQSQEVAPGFAIPSEEVSPFSKEGARDIGSQIGRGLAYGVGDVVALPATVQQLSSAAAEAGRNVYGHGRELLGYEQPGATERASAARAAIREGSAPASEREGKTTRLYLPGPLGTAAEFLGFQGTSIPTSKGAEDIIRRALNLSSEPAKTGVGKYAEAGARAIPSMFVGGPQGLMAKTAMGTGMGMGAQAGEDLARATSVDPAYLALPGALIGGYAGGKGAQALQSLTSPTTSAAQQLAAATARDIAAGKGTFKAVYDEAGNVIAPGASIAEATAGGPAASRLIGKAGGIPYPNAVAELEAINTNLASRAASAPQSLGAFARTAAGVRQDAPELMEAIEAANRGQINMLYDIARSVPAASNMNSPGLRNAMSGSIMQRAQAEAARMAGSPVGTNIVVPTANSGGNLHFYDQVSRILSDDIGQAIAAGRKSEAKDLTLLRKNLLREVDAVVPEFASARGAAFDNFGQQNAVKAGFESFSEKNPFNLRETLNAYNSSNPQQQDLFRQGLGYSLQQIAENSGTKQFLNYISKPQNEAFLSNVFGRDAVDAMKGSAVANNMLAGMRPYQIVYEQPSRVMDIARGGIGAEIAKDVSTGSIEGAGAKLMGLGATFGYGWLSHIQDKRKAMALLNYVQSTDPKDMARFYQMVRSDPSISSTYFKILKAMRTASVTEPHMRAEEGQSTGGRIERREGGRVGIDHSGRAASLVRAAEAAKKQESKTTEPLLQAPDEHIVKALSIANEAI